MIRLLTPLKIAIEARLGTRYGLSNRIVDWELWFSLHNGYISSRNFQGRNLLRTGLLETRAAVNATRNEQRFTDVAKSELSNGGQN